MKQKKKISVSLVERWVRRYQSNTHRAQYRKSLRDYYGRCLEEFFKPIISGETVYGGEDVVRLREAYKAYLKTSKETV